MLLAQGSWYAETVIRTKVTPLTLSLSPWERERPNNGCDGTPSPIPHSLANAGTISCKLAKASLLRGLG